jgi:hypothetical protein
MPGWPSSNSRLGGYPLKPADLTFASVRDKARVLAFSALGGPIGATSASSSPRGPTFCPTRGFRRTAQRRRFGVIALVASPPDPGFADVRVNPRLVAFSALGGPSRPPRPRRRDVGERVRNTRVLLGFYSPFLARTRVFEEHPAVLAHSGPDSQMDADAARCQVFSQKLRTPPQPVALSESRPPRAFDMYTYTYT